MDELEVSLDKAIARFRAQNEVYLSSIPPTVHNVKMRDLVDKYGGDIKLCAEAQAANNCKWINVPPINTAVDQSTADPPLLSTVPPTEFDPTPPSANTRVIKKRKRRVKFDLKQPSANTRVSKKRKREVKFDLTPPSTNTQGAKEKKREVKINHNQTPLWRPSGVFD